MALIFLAVCLGCVWIGMKRSTECLQSASCEPFLVGESIMGFLGAAVNLVAAAMALFH